MALICWSGGCDSTLILWDLLQKQSKNDPPIRTIAIDHFAVWAGEEQDAARTKILFVLRERGFRIEHETLTIRCGDRNGLPCGTSEKPSTLRIPQAPLWLINAIMHLEPKEDLYVGYIRGDDVWHYIQEYRWVFQYAAYLVGREGKLFTPLEFFTKADVIQALKLAKLFQYCWTCSSPKNGKQCGKCKECKTQKLALYELSNLR